ncbi:hypothetical protein KUTeg_010005 [Tegillarca granosa]|uniref:BTB domain-containing protein n=1 Tax=Tegillarca granosa TaxID=220873 RepID=A0ABQ9F8I9_TEGGR|nr:hypothetical protein KUTeg_010005 [Tegillarca granosa]
MDTVTLNIGGTIFETSRKTLEVFPETKLANLKTNDSAYNKNKDYYFFDRNPELFNNILDFYRNGSLHFSENICFASIQQELEFWEIPIERISPCCMKVYYKYDSNLHLHEEIEKELSQNFMDYDKLECQRSPFVRFKRNVWLFFDQPHSSLAAKIYSYVFLLLVIVSFIAYAMGSIERWRVQYISDEEIAYVKNNATSLPGLFVLLDFNNPKLMMFLTTRIIDPLIIIRSACRIFFVIDFLFHFSFCPRKCAFFLNGMNLLDLVLVIAMGVNFGIDQNPNILLTSQAAAIAYSIFHTINFLRILRIFRLLKQSNGLRVLLMALTSSIKPLFLLLVTFFLASIFFGNFVFYAELFVPDTFPNVFVGIWWAIITMTTVGYGDNYPKSPFGCVVGSLCATCGILLLSLPVAMVASSFSEYFNISTNREKMLKLRKERLNSSNKPGKSSQVWPIELTESREMHDLKGNKQ